MNDPAPNEDAAAIKERLRVRLITARTYAGLTAKDLSAELRRRGHVKGYSVDNIGLMERGERPIRPQEVPVLAEACGVSPAFFSVDFATLKEPSPLDAAIEDRLERLTSELRTEQLERANLEAALLEVLGADLQAALAGGDRG